MASPQSENQANAAHRRPNACLLLCEPGAPAPEVLMRALVSRGLATRVVEDEPGVMSVLADRSPQRRVLIVIEPGCRERLAELLNAVQQYHREVLCWQYADRGAGQPLLRSMDQRVSGPGRVDEHVSSAETMGAGDTQNDAPIGKIEIRRRRPIEKLLTRVPGTPLSTREVVTRQELTMLLGPVPGEAG